MTWLSRLLIVPLLAFGVAGADLAKLDGPCISPATSNALCQDDRRSDNSLGITPRMAYSSFHGPSLLGP